MSFSATVAAIAFFAWWSSMMTSIFLPLTPPLALISSTAMPYAFLNLSPKGASGPVMGWGAPILSVSCAAAGVAAAPSKIPNTSPKEESSHDQTLHWDDGVVGQADSRVVPEALSRSGTQLVADDAGAFHEGPELSPRRLSRARHQAAIGAGEETRGIDVGQRLSDPLGDQRGRLDLLGSHV